MCFECQFARLIISSSLSLKSGEFSRHMRRILLALVVQKILNLPVLTNFKGNIHFTGFHLFTRVQILTRKRPHASQHSLVKMVDKPGRRH